MTRAWKDKVYLQSDRGQQFMTLYMRVQRRLFGYVFPISPIPLMQMILFRKRFLSCGQNSINIKPGTNFAAWALCIARYQILSYRKQITKKKRLFSSQAIEAIQNVAESTDNQEQERQKALMLCLDKLGKKERKILYFRYEIGATLRAVSERLNMNNNTLYSVLGQIHVTLLNCVRKNMV